MLHVNTFSRPGNQALVMGWLQSGAVAEARGYGAYRCLVAVNESTGPVDLSFKSGKENSMPWLPRQLQVSCWFKFEKVRHMGARALVFVSLAANNVMWDVLSSPSLYQVFGRPWSAFCRSTTISSFWSNIPVGTCESFLR